MNMRDLIQSWDEAVQNASAKIVQTEETNLQNVAGLALQSDLRAGEFVLAPLTYCGGGCQALHTF